MPYYESIFGKIVNVQWGGSAWVSVQIAASIGGSNASWTSSINLGSKSATIASTYISSTNVHAGLTAFYVFFAKGGPPPPDSYPNNGYPVYTGDGRGPDGFHPNDPYTFSTSSGAAACAAFFNSTQTFLVSQWGPASVGSLNSPTNSSTYDATYILKFPSFPQKPAFTLVLGGKALAVNCVAYTLKTHTIKTPNAPIGVHNIPPTGPLSPVDGGVWETNLVGSVGGGNYPFMLKRVFAPTPKATLTELWPTTVAYDATYAVKDTDLNTPQTLVGNNLRGPPPKI